MRHNGKKGLTLVFYPSNRASQGVTKRCRLPWLTNSTLVYETNCGRGVGWGGKLRDLSQ
jgi:hypothetical protein